MKPLFVSILLVLIICISPYHMKKTKKINPINPSGLGGNSYATYGDVYIFPSKKGGMGGEGGAGYPIINKNNYDRTTTH